MNAMERRYREEEVRRIFKLATTDKVADPPGSSTATGLTLAEIQSIGQEVGIAPDRVARAAASLDMQPLPESRKVLGIPVEVGVTAMLPRAPTEDEWQILVAELRGTFRAQGKVTVDPMSRVWRNGNLHASVEPTGAGYRLRMGTVKGNASVANAMGAIGLVAAGMLSGSHFLYNDPINLAVPAVFGVAGLSTLAANALRLPIWARQRQTQMTRIAGRIRALMEASDNKG